MSSTAKMPHGHAEVGERAVDLLRRGALLDEELAFVHVREHHAVADEPRTVADDDAELPKLPGQRDHASRARRGSSRGLARFRPGASRAPG